MVAHALEIVRDLHRGGEEPQVAGHRLLRGEEPDHGLFDLELEPVQLAVAGDHALGLLAVALEQRLDRRGERGLRIARHVEERDLELREIVVEMAVGFNAHVPCPLPPGMARGFLWALNRTCP